TTARSFCPGRSPRRSSLRETGVRDGSLRGALASMAPLRSRRCRLGRFAAECVPRGPSRLEDRAHHPKVSDQTSSRHALRALDQGREKIRRILDLFWRGTQGRPPLRSRVQGEPPCPATFRKLEVGWPHDSCEIQRTNG